MNKIKNNKNKNNKKSNGNTKVMCRHLGCGEMTTTGHRARHETFPRQHPNCTYNKDSNCEGCRLFSKNFEVRLLKPIKVKKDNQLNISNSRASKKNQEKEKNKQSEEIFQSLSFLCDLIEELPKTQAPSTGLNSNRKSIIRVPSAEFSIYLKFSKITIN